MGAKILTIINGIESDGIKSELTLDLFMHMVRGKDERWAIVWSKVNEVSPKVMQPMKPTGLNNISSSPFFYNQAQICWEATLMPNFGKPSPQSEFKT